MARTRSSITTGTTENNIYFYPAGGHSHDGQNSSLIDTTKYSVYDFNFGYISDNPVRRQFQINSFESLKQVIRDTVTDSVLAPAGIVLQPNTLNGATIIARTITADQITVGSITANELNNNIILVNNTIRSNNYVVGNSGWQISNIGSAEFNDVTVRGTVESLYGNIGGWQINPLGIFSYDSNVKLFYTGDFQIGSNANNQASITSDGDFYVIGTDSSTGYLGSSRFYGPWFKIVQGSNNNANASTATQSQLTFDSLRIADAGNAATYISYISVENPSSGESHFRIVKNSNDEIYIGNNSIIASNAISNFKQVKVLNGTNPNANASTSAQSQLTFNSLIIADAGNATSFTSYIAMSNPTSGESFFEIRKDLANQEVYISNTYVTASNAYATFNFTQSNTIWATDLVVFGNTTVWGNTNLEGSNTYVAAKAINVETLFGKIGGYYANRENSYTLLDGTIYNNVLMFPKTDMWMHYAGPTVVGGTTYGYSSYLAWTAILKSDWYQNPPAGPIPYTRWGVSRDGWAGFIEQYYGSANSYSSRTISGASDRRVKDNIQPLNSIVDPLYILDSIEPKIYDYIHYKSKKLDENGIPTDEWNDIPKKFGFIAQDLIETLGEYKDLVTDEVNDPNYDFKIYTTEDRGIIAILWAAVRELKKKIDILEQGNN